MSDAPETFELIWHERTITVSYAPNWLNTGYCHIELRCPEPLPVTGTGYRSHFIPDDPSADHATVGAFVTNWLDTAATAPAWQRYLDDSRQLRLF